MIYKNIKLLTFLAFEVAVGSSFQKKQEEIEETFNKILIIIIYSGKYNNSCLRNLR